MHNTGLPITILSALNALFWENPAAQSVGLLALCIGVSAFFQKDDQKLRYFLTVFTLVMAVHFVMLEQWTGALMAFLGSLRNYASSKTNSLKIMYGFIFVVWVLAIPNIESLIHFLPVIATSLGTVAVFRMQGIKLRLLMSMGTICWLAHNYLVFSIGGVLVESLFLVINMRTMLKLRQVQN
ncbi:YgjV family protein [Paraglaciecola sp. 2405UD69-4]|uniref:YgjV family protein n=1 Tax=Paraglaciecola sp. 2405UD69-4 TaxID=3391836 RepID=UPI0039C9D65B